MMSQIVAMFDSFIRKGKYAYFILDSYHYKRHGIQYFKFLRLDFKIGFLKQLSINQDSYWIHEINPTLKHSYPNLYATS